MRDDVHRVLTARPARQGREPFEPGRAVKGAVSLHLHTQAPETQALVGKLGRLKKSVGCLYVNKLTDIDLGVLEKLVKASVASAMKEFASKGWPVTPS